MKLIVPVVQTTSPSTVANRVVDLDGDTLSGSDGDPVTTWTDTTSSLAFTQATAGLRPTLKVAVANGHDAVRFDGVDDGLAVTSSVMQSTSRTLFMVCRLTAAPTTSAVVFQQGPSTHYGSTSAVRLFMRYVNASNASVFPTSTFGTQFTTTEWSVLTCMVTTTGSNVRSLLRKNGATRLDSTLTTGHAAVTTTDLRVGGRVGDLYFPGDIARIIGFSRALTPAEYVGIERHLGDRYGATVG